MKEKKRISMKMAVLLLTVCLLIGGTVGGTIAYLFAQSETVTNTFTFGDITLTLTENTGSNYKIVPGGTAEKNPTLTVKANSEPCYVYVLVDNELVINGAVVATPNIGTEWTSIGASGTRTLYRYKSEVDASASEQDLTVFTKVTYSPDIEMGNKNDLDNKKIAVSGYAYQSANVTQDAADTAAKTWAGLPTT